ncbi:MAG: SAM-dependent methyltransferase [Bacteroidales bacterium]|nr:MAG: SAM-dependent methyltransferase [Bacteroidales bacterium]
MLLENIRFLKKYINFRLKSTPRGGHGIHSPFVYDLYTNCIDIKQKEAIFEAIETLRKEMINNSNPIPTSSFGLGTRIIDSSEQTVGKVVKTAATPPYMGQLLYRLVKYLKPQSIIELGTSAGFGAMYLARGDLNTSVTTIEGDTMLAKIASENFNKLGIGNVTLINGEFELELPKILANTEKIGLIFIDGDHSEEATLRYFKLCSEKANHDSLILIDDIRWSQGMENAWNTISQNENVSISIDLFNCGLAFFRKGVAKQHFNLRYGPF